MQRWKSQKNKIHRLAFRVSIHFSLLGLAYDFSPQSPRFPFGNHKHLTKVSRPLVRDQEFLKSIGRSGFYQDFCLFCTYFLTL
jgi:hypothetical protein